MESNTFSSDKGQKVFSEIPASKSFKGKRAFADLLHFNDEDQEESNSKAFNPKKLKLCESNNPENFQIISILGDGNCLYRAVMVGMGYAEVHYDSLRSLVCEYQRSNPSVFDEHYFEEEEYNITREQYIQEISTGRRWGGALEIACIVEILQVSINVFLRGNLEQPMMEFHPNVEANSFVNLLYKPGANAHYDTLLKVISI